MGTVHGQHRPHEFQYADQWQQDQSESPGTAAGEHWLESRSPAYQSDDEPSSVSPGSGATNPYKHRHTTQSQSIY